jgi:hypothetical protein
VKQPLPPTGCTGTPGSCAVDEKGASPLKNFLPSRNTNESKHDSLYRQEHFFPLKKKDKEKKSLLPAALMRDN